MTPYPADFGPFILGALPYAGAEALRIAAWCTVAVVLATVAVISGHRAGLLLARRIYARRVARYGQGVPPIARRLNQADAQTEAISMRDIVVRPQLEDICPQFCDNLAEVGDPASCGCAGACGRSWCPRRRNPVPVTWTEREEGVR